MNGEPENDVKIKTEPSDSEEDPIVHEIPVFVAKSLAKQLYLLQVSSPPNQGFGRFIYLHLYSQYPVRPCRMSYDTSTVLSARVKPKQKKVEVTMALNTECTNFDRSKGEQIALNVDGSDSKDRTNDDMVFPEGQMDRLVLSSTQAISDTSRYAVGILDANEFHITPLEAVLSLRPNFDYMDQSDRTAKAEGRGAQGDEDEDDPDEPAPEMKAVTVKFAKGGKMDQERAEKMREKSFEYQQKKAKQEPWTRVKFNHVKTEKWQKESQKMFCKNMSEEVPDLSLKPTEYLDSLK